MKYNKWTLNFNTKEFLLDTSDQEERLYQKSEVHFLGSLAYIRFPKKDEKTNEEYKKLLVQTVLISLKKEQDRINEEINWLSSL
jgi:hypothetical protein